MKHLHCTIDIGLKYVSNNDIQLHCYIDADWPGNVEDRKSTSKGCFSLGFSMISWMSKKKAFITLSIFEAEYIATSLAICEVVWI